MDHVAEFVDELTDWHNLLQGGLGSLVGSFLGVLGAFFAAYWTIQQHRRHDRELARETAGVEGIAVVQKKLELVGQGLLAVKIHRQYSADPPRFDQVLQLLKEPSAQLSDALTEVRPFLPERMASLLGKISIDASMLTVAESLLERYGTLASVERQLDGIRDMQIAIYRYRRDPVMETRRLDKELRRLRRRSWRREARQRAIRWVLRRRPTEASPS